MRYTDEFLDEIRAKNDIVDVVSGYVKLKRSGRNYMGLCPFHNEKTPSFSVSPDKQIFHCFGCGVGGNVFHFVSKIENINFVESLEILATRVGMKLPEDNNSEDTKKAKLKSRIYEINNLAMNFYHKNLYNTSSKQAQEYVKKRKLDNKVLETFKIGYAGFNNELLKLLKEENYTDSELLESGLIKKSKEGNLYDAYRGRLMFPIVDSREKVIAFGGRVLDNSLPKYINSPENVVYSKSRNLFGLNIAKKYSPKEILIVEGYMDVISLAQRGINNVVASLGTALTEAQGRLLRRTSEKIIIGYDADGAGQAATLRGLEILETLGCDVRILELNRQAKDPDEYVIKYGPDFFKNCMKKSISLVEFKVKMLKKDLNLDIVNDKIKFLNEIAKILSKVQNRMEQEVYMDKISSTYGISKDAIYGEINKILNKNNINDKKQINVKQIKSVLKEEKNNEIDEKVIKTEKLLIYLLLNYGKEIYERLKEIVNIDDIEIEKNKKILNVLYGKITEDANIEDALNWFREEDEINYLSEILATDFEITNLEKCINELISFYQKERLINKKKEILEKMEDSSLTKEEQSDLVKELNEIIINLAKIK